MTNMKVMKIALALLMFCIFIPNVQSQVKQLEVEPNHSTIGFKIDIAGFSKVTGKFTDYSIDVDWHIDTPRLSSIQAEIQAASIHTGIPDRDDHLKSADFFETETYPVITFNSDSIRQLNYSHFEAFGQFSMHGITNQIILPFQLIKMDGNTFGIRSELTIKRLDYDVGSGFAHTSMPNFLSNQIDVEIFFWTRKRKE